MYLTTLLIRVEMFCKECRTKVFDTVDKRETRKYYWSPEELSCPQSAAIGPPSGLTQPSSSKPCKKRMKNYCFYTAVDTVIKIDISRFDLSIIFKTF